MSHIPTRKSICLATGALLLASTVATAQDLPEESWQWGAEVYFWGASISSDTLSDQDVDIGIDKLLDNFNAGFMGTLAAKKGKLSFFGDLI